MKSILIALMAITLIASASAADVYRVKSAIFIEGEIEDGDAEKTAVVLASRSTVGIFRVNSLGGSVTEAIKIGSLIEGAKAGVLIKKGELCASACFFLYINGYFRGASGFSPKDGETPSNAKRLLGHTFVGIHRPYLGSKNEVTADSATKQGELINQIKVYLRKKAIPEYLIDEMMGHPSNDIYWLQDKDLLMLGEYDAGVEEVLIKECNYVREMWKQSQERQDRFIKCSVDVVFEREFGPQQQRFIEKLRTGWRPWG